MINFILNCDDKHFYYQRKTVPLQAGEWIKDYYLSLILPITFLIHINRSCLATFAFLQIYILIKSKYMLPTIGLQSMGSSNSQKWFSHSTTTFVIIIYNYGFPGGTSGKETACQCCEHEMWVPSLGREDPLEKSLETHSSILAWRIPLTEKLRGLQSTGSQRDRHNWSDLACMSVF